MKYIALIHKDSKSDYGVHFPDFPGCVTGGSTLDEAKDMAFEALSEHMALMRDLGEKIPTPSSLEEIMQEAENRNAVAFMLEAPSRKKVRVNVTFDQEVLDLIDHKAKDLNLTRSAFLAESALSYDSHNDHHS
jgi:predicted RNase H-like HicB family nuclease